MTQCPADEANVEGKWPRTIRHYIPPAAVKHKNVGRRRCILYDSVGLSTIRSCLAWQMPGEAQVRDGCIQIVHTQTMSDTQSRPNATRARRQSTPCRFTGAQKQTPQYAVVKDCNFDSGKFPNPIPPLEQEEGCGRGGGFGPSLVRSHSKETPRAPQIPIPIRSIHRRAPGLDLVFARASPAGSPLRDAGCLVLGFQPRPRPQIANGESEAGGHTHTHTHKHGKEIKAMQSRPVDSSRTTMKGQTSSAAGRRLRVPADGCGQPLLHRDRQLHCHFRRQTLSARRKVGSGTTMTCTAPTATFANGPGALIHVRRGLLELAHGRREVGVLLHWAVCGCHGEATTTAHVCAIVIRGEGDMRQI